MTSELNRFKVVSNELKMERIAESDEVFKSLTLSTLSLDTVISDAPSVLTPLIRRPFGGEKPILYIVIYSIIYSIIFSNFYRL